jgi:hypothetical protein
MSYSCPDCDSPLAARVRQLVFNPDAVIELAGGDSVIGIKGQAFVVSIECSNGCSADSDAAPPQKEETCGVRGCGKPPGHEGRHRTAKPEADK